MGLHSHSDREARKRKYAAQFARTAENKKRREAKRQKKIQQSHNKKAVQE